MIVLRAPSSVLKVSLKFNNLDSLPRKELHYAMQWRSTMRYGAQIPSCAMQYRASSSNLVIIGHARSKLQRSLFVWSYHFWFGLRGCLIKLFLIWPSRLSDRMCFSYFSYLYCFQILALPVTKLFTSLKRILVSFLLLIDLLEALSHARKIPLHSRWERADNCQLVS